MRGVHSKPLRFAVHCIQRLAGHARDELQSNEELQTTKRPKSNGDSCSQAQPGGRGGEKRKMEAISTTETRGLGYRRPWLQEALYQNKT